MHIFIRFRVQWLHYNHSGVIMLFIQETICLLKEYILIDSSLWEKTMVPELTSFYFDYVLPKLKST
jgi:hypothetical protein